jgi:two-component system KDP operon response regulator KdpE
MATLLLVDDDETLLELLADYLQNAGYTITTAVNGKESLHRFYEVRPDLVILDVTMPQQDGWQTLARIRELARTPVIMLTARSDEDSVLRGFRLGSDDYVTKPFSFAELAARIHSVLSRSPATKTADAVPDSTLLQHGDLVIDLAAKRLWRNNELVPLTPTEFRLLLALAQHAGKVVSPQTLVREVWGEQYANDVGYVRRYIWHLRKKVEIDPNQPRYIHNEHGFGYRFYAVSENNGGLPT